MVHVVYPDTATTVVEGEKVQLVPAIAEEGTPATQSVALLAKPHGELELGGNDDARLTEIEQIFDHQQMALLQKYELAKEYVEIAEGQFSRQDVTKTRGRPQGGISLAARKLSVPGRTEAGRKKWLERALKIANLSPAVKTAAQKARVVKFQSKLIEIADADGEAAQLKKVAEIAKRQQKKANGDDGFLRVVIRYPPDSKDKFFSKLTEILDEFGAHQAR